LGPQSFHIFLTEVLVNPVSGPWVSFPGSSPFSPVSPFFRVLAGTVSASRFLVQGPTGQGKGRFGPTGTPGVHGSKAPLGPKRGEAPFHWHHESPGGPTHPFLGQEGTPVKPPGLQRQGQGSRTPAQN